MVLDTRDRKAMAVEGHFESIYGTPIEWHTGAQELLEFVREGGILDLEWVRTKSGHVCTKTLSLGDNGVFVYRERGKKGRLNAKQVARVIARVSGVEEALASLGV